MNLVDAGFTDAAGLVASARDHGITLVGPPPADDQWQARTEGAFAIEQFDLDWDRQIATCPAGQTSGSWIPDTHGGHDDVRIRFSLTHCKACPLKARCTRSNRRVLSPRRRQEHETLAAARTAAEDPAFIAERKRRAGIEGTLSKAVRTDGLRRSRYIGAAQAHLQQVLTAAAINLGRIAVEQFQFQQAEQVPVQMCEPMPRRCSLDRRHRNMSICTHIAQYRAATWAAARELRVL